MSNYKAFLVALCVLTTSFGLTNSQNVLEKFVIDRLANYGTWIKATNLDPSPTVTGPTYIKSSSFMVELDCYLSQHNIRGFSDGINVTSVKADLDRITVSFKIQNNVTFSGRYVGNGSIWWDDSPLSGSGVWNITVPEVDHRNLVLDYSVSDSGYVYITNYDLTGINIPSYYEEEYEVYFQDLWDSEEAASYEETIKSGLYGGYRSYFRDDPENALKRTYLQYFQEVFQNTTWADIIIPSGGSKTTEQPIQSSSESPPEDDIENSGEDSSTESSKTEDSATSSTTPSSTAGRVETNQVFRFVAVFVSLIVMTRC